MFANGELLTSLFIVPYSAGLTNSHIAASYLNTGSTTSLNLVKQWIETCTASHTYCSQARKHILPTRLIDVEPQEIECSARLVSSGVLGSKTKYLTLSYRWGGRSSFVLRRSNLDAMMRSIDVAILPRTIAEAINITKRLGYRYLWIDSLCIIQDSQEDWLMEAPQMGQVYSNSTLTLAATAGTDSETGLCAERYLIFELPCRILDTPMGGLHVMGNITPALVDGLRNIDDAPLNQRGWVLQERLLSSRILNFMSKNPVWECYDCQADEGDSQGRPVVNKLRWGARELLYPKSTSQFRCTLNNVRARVNQLGFWPSDHLKIPHGEWSRVTSWRVHDMWSNVLYKYTSCQLTDPNDRLPAISGILREFERALS